MSKISRNTESTRRPGKGRIRVGSDGSSDSKDDSGHDNEESPLGLGQAY